MDWAAILAEFSNSGTMTIVEGQARPEKQTRASRPGQVGPSARSRYMAGLKRQFANDGNEPERRQRPAGDSEYSERMHGLAENWNEKRPENVEKYKISFPRALEVREQRKSALLRIVQEEINSTIAVARCGHPCCALLDDGGDAPCLELIRTASIVYYEFGWRGVVTVPLYQCTKCNKMVTVSPLDVGCAGAAPTEGCETWFSQDLARFFQDVHLNNGLSANGELFIKCILPLPLPPPGKV